VARRRRPNHDRAVSRGALVSAALAALIAAGAASGTARAQEVTIAPPGRWAAQADLGGTLMSRSSTSSTSLSFARAEALGVGVDRRFDSLHLFVRAEGNAWRDRRDDGTYDFVLSFGLGLGARIDYGAGRLRSSIAAGATLLAAPTDVDQAGRFGTFVDLRPLGYAWPLAPGARVGVVPLSLTLAIPVLTGIPLVSIQYRTTVFAERDF
jgi:hypothetical protein